ncbi:MAG: GNAT family N-acetyltransferase, partial [Gemmatimonadota bacterium]
VQEVHSVAIRAKAFEAYEPEVVEVWVDAFNPQNFPKNIERMEFYVAELQDGRIGAFLAFDLDSTEIDSVYVAPWGRGLGLGSFLLGFAEEKGRLAGLESMWLDASLNAVSFYEKYGWVEVEKHSRIRKGVAIPVVRMEKVLNT